MTPEAWQEWHEMAPSQKKELFRAARAGAYWARKDLWDKFRAYVWTHGEVQKLNQVKEAA